MSGGKINLLKRPSQPSRRPPLNRKKRREKSCKKSNFSPSISEGILATFSDGCRPWRLREEELFGEEKGFYGEDCNKGMSNATTMLLNSVPPTKSVARAFVTFQITFSDFDFASKRPEQGRPWFDERIKPVQHD